MKDILRGFIWPVLIFGLLMAFLPAWVGAAPTVSSVSGTLTHGQTLTVGGSSFGTRASTTVYIFDTFDSGSANAGWASDNDLTFVTGSQRNSNSVYKATCNFTSGSHDDARLQAGSTVARVWYISYWWFLGSDWDFGTSGFGGTDKWLANIKLVRWWNPGGSAQENVYVQYKGDSNAVELLHEDLPGGIDTPISSARTALTKNTWHKFQFEFTDSSALDALDAAFKMYMDAGAARYSETGQKYKDVENLNKRPFIVGWQGEWDCNEGTPDLEGCQVPNIFNMDDVVMQADTLTRIEIGDNATYTSCTIREDQKILSWTGTTGATIQYNEGSLTGNKYLFVVDDTGAPSSGFLLGSGADSTAPEVSITAPANLATVSGAAVTVSASATDAVGVEGVQFKLDGANLGAEDTGAPYSISWDSTAASEGAHSITAVARDAAANSATSNAVTVTVDNVANPSGPEHTIKSPKLIGGGHVIK